MNVFCDWNAANLVTKASSLKLNKVGFSLHVPFEGSRKERTRVPQIPSPAEGIGG